MNIGTNVYGLGDRMHRDLPGLMRQVKAIGFTSIEPLIVFSEDVTAFANDPDFPKFLWLDTETPAKIAAINEIGMAVTTCHYNFAPSLDVRAKKDAIIRLAGETSLRSFVISLMLTRAEDCERHAAAPSTR